MLSSGAGGNPRYTEELESAEEELPHCGNPDVVRIVYGYPLGDDFEREQRGEIVLGGCVIGPESPTHVCRACGENFGRLRKDSKSLGGAAFVSELGN